MVIREFEYLGAEEMVFLDVVFLGPESSCAVVVRSFVAVCPAPGVNGILPGQQNTFARRDVQDPHDG